MKRALRTLGIGLLLFLLVLVGGSAAVYYLVGFDRLANEAIAKAKPQIEESLGRTIRVGEVQTGFFPTISVHVPEVAIEGAEGEPPLLSLSSVDVEVALWQAIFTLGKKLEIRDIRLREPRIVILRRADGSLSIDDLLAEGEAAPEEESGEQAALPEGFRIGRIRVESGALYLVDAERIQPGDLSASALSYVEAIDLLVENLGLGERVEVDLSLA